MVANIRREEICRLLKKQQAVTTTALSERFNVSVETIRKDLMYLEKESKLVRVHGGAMMKSTTMPYVNLAKRMESMQTEKTIITKLAASFVNNGDIIAIDTGSTAIEFIAALMDRLDTLTIVTHSMDVFQRACDYKNFEVILCGGYYLKNENSFYGDFTEYIINNLHVSKVFIFPAVLSLKFGICDFNHKLARIQKKLIEIGDEVFVVADSSKYEKSALVKASDMSESYLYITDLNLSEEIKEIYRSNNINIITPKE